VNVLYHHIYSILALKLDTFFSVSFIHSDKLLCASGLGLYKRVTSMSSNTSAHLLSVAVQWQRADNNQSAGSNIITRLRNFLWHSSINCMS